jgi:hypothetical protein
VLVIVNGCVWEIELECAFLLRIVSVHKNPVTNPDPHVFHSHTTTPRSWHCYGQWRLRNFDGISNLRFILRNSAASAAHIAHNRSNVENALELNSDIQAIVV